MWYFGAGSLEDPVDFNSQVGFANKREDSECNWAQRQAPYNTARAGWHHGHANFEQIGIGIVQVIPVLYYSFQISLFDYIGILYTQIYFK